METGERPDPDEARNLLDLTRAGRTAYSRHLTVLKDIVGDP